MFSAARAPVTRDEWNAYYALRWQVLRAAWQQPPGSEKDELDNNNATHRMIADDGHVVAIGRLHIVDNITGQIRYMAVDPDYENQGLGKQILHALEYAAKQQSLSKILLHARENAVGFYDKQGYQRIKPSHTLFETIKHYQMEKTI